MLCKIYCGIVTFAYFNLKLGGQNCTLIQRDINNTHKIYNQNAMQLANKLYIASYLMFLKNFIRKWQ